MKKNSPPQLNNTTDKTIDTLTMLFIYFLFFSLSSQQLSTLGTEQILASKEYKKHLIIVEQF